MASNQQVSRKGNPRGNQYLPPSAEKKLEKKLSAAERSAHILTEKPVMGLTTTVNEKDLGKGAIVLHIGQAGKEAAQMVMHRPIGNTPDGLASDWAFTSKGQLGHFLGGATNPFEKKTAERVNALKLEFGIQKKLLKKGSDGRIMYPNGIVRNVALDDCRMYHDIHKSVEGGVAMTPIFVYGGIDVQGFESAYLNALAESPEVQAAIAKETVSYRAHETKDPVTGQAQVTMKWANGLPPDQLLTVLMDVISTGSYNAAKWDPIKEVAPKKADPFATWGYTEGDIPQDKLAVLKKNLQEYAKLRKEHNVLKPQGAKAIQEETDQQKADRRSKHNEMQKAAHVVNASEKFAFKLPQIKASTSPAGGKATLTK